MAVHKKYPALGRGLDALISEEPVKAEGSSSINEIEISSIQVNPDQPRREFDEAALKKTIPANRFGQPEEVAELVAFLASPQAGYITGNVISINGGLYT